jgi:hypothetical protein
MVVEEKEKRTLGNMRIGRHEDSSVHDWKGIQSQWRVTPLISDSRVPFGVGHQGSPDTRVGMGAKDTRRLGEGKKKETC